MECTNGVDIDKYVERAAAGVTFALPQTDVHAAFKGRLLQILGRADWSQYYGRPVDAIAGGPLGWVEEEGLRAYFSAGAEAAMLEYTRRAGVRRLLCPRYSYPGYARIAAALGIGLEVYDGIADLLEAAGGPGGASGALAVVTLPGNPLDCPVGPELWERLARAGLPTLVDCAYEPPDTARFREYVRAAREFDMPVVHSMAKSYPLAGLRLGGLVCRPDHPAAASLETRFWTALSCAAMEALSDSEIHDLLLKQREEQRALKQSILARLLELGHRVRGSESDLFVTVEHSVRLANLDLKLYGNTFMRIDCSRENLSVLEASNAG